MYQMTVCRSKVFIAYAGMLFQEVIELNIEYTNQYRYQNKFEQRNRNINIFKLGQKRASLVAKLMFFVNHEINLIRAFILHNRCVVFFLPTTGY